MANTVIQLKYSEITSTPTSLNVAEPAYSNTSGKLFIGRTTGSPVAIGGKYFTDLVDGATDANTASTIVKRDALGVFQTTAVKGSLFGNANTASAWQSARTIGVSGDANGTVSIDGTINANIPLTLVNTAVTPGTYGGSSTGTVITVDSKGRITSASNVALSAGASSLNIAGDSGTETINLALDTVTFAGGDGLTSVAVAANNTVKFDVDNTVIRTTGGQTIAGALTVTGNLIVSGNTITQDVEILKVEDSLIQLAANNAGDTVDIGFFGQYNESNSTKYTGLIRDASDSGKFKLVTGGTVKPIDANTFDTSTYSTATLVANVETSNIYSSGVNILTTITGTATIANAAFEKANAASLHANSAFNLANGTAGVANTDFTTISATAGTYGNLTSIPSITIAANGRVSSITTNNISSIAIANTQITGVMNVVQGGTGLSSYTTGDIVFASGSTTLSSLAGVATGNVLISRGVGTAPQYDKVGLTTHVSGTLAVGNGGTGNTALTANGVVIGQGSSALTTIFSSTEGHVLQISNTGAPVFGSINGGSF